MSKIKIRKVRVTRGQEYCDSCPCNCDVANEEFPQLAARVTVDDCTDFFVAPDGRFWGVEDFIQGHSFTKVWVDEDELNA